MDPITAFLTGVLAGAGEELGKYGVRRLIESFEKRHQVNNAELTRPLSIRIERPTLNTTTETYCYCHCSHIDLTRLHGENCHCYCIVYID